MMGETHSKRGDTDRETCLSVLLLSPRRLLSAVPAAKAGTQTDKDPPPDDASHRLSSLQDYGLDHQQQKRTLRQEDFSPAPRDVRTRVLMTVSRSSFCLWKQAKDLRLRR